MNQYHATYWDGRAWIDINADPAPYREAADLAFSALLDGRGTTRLRPVHSPFQNILGGARSAWGQTAPVLDNNSGDR